MIDVVLQVLVEIIVNPIGGALRWVVYRKKTLKQYVSDNWEANLGAFFCFLALLSVIVALIINL